MMEKGYLIRERLSKDLPFTDVVSESEGNVSEQGERGCICD